MTVLCEVWYHLFLGTHTHTRVGKKWLVRCFFRMTSATFLIFFFYFNSLTLWLYVIIVLKYSCFFILAVVFIMITSILIMSSVVLKNQVLTPKIPLSQ